MDKKIKETRLLTLKEISFFFGINEISNVQNIVCKNKFKIVFVPIEIKNV